MHSGVPKSINAPLARFRQCLVRRWQWLDLGKYWPLFPLILPILLSNPDAGSKRLWIKPTSWILLVSSGIYGLHRTAYEQDTRQENYATRAAVLFKELGDKQGDRIITNIYAEIQSERENTAAAERDAAAGERDAAQRDRNAVAEEVDALEAEIRDLEGYVDEKRGGEQTSESGSFPLLSASQLEDLNNYFREGQGQVDACVAIDLVATEIINSSVADYLQAIGADTGGQGYTHRELATFIRDIDYMLRWATYTILTKDFSTLDEQVLPLLREQRDHGNSRLSLVELVPFLKDATERLAGQPARAAIERYLDYIRDGLKASA